MAVLSAKGKEYLMDARKAQEERDVTTERGRKRAIMPLFYSILQSNFVRRGLKHSQANGFFFEYFHIFFDFFHIFSPDGPL